MNRDLFCRLRYILLLEKNENKHFNPDNYRWILGKNAFNQLIEDLPIKCVSLNLMGIEVEVDLAHENCIELRKIVYKGDL